MSTTPRTIMRGLAIAATIAAVATTAACSSPADSGSAAASCEPAGKPVTIQYWNWVSGMDKVVDLWNKKNPDIQVELKNISNDAYGTISNSLKAGQAPELAQVGYDQLANLRLQDGFVDASKCEDAVKAKSDFVPWTWSQATFGGEGVYAIPQDTGPMALYYRADLFEKYGIAVPTTWEQYEAAGKALKAADPNLSIASFDLNNAEAFNGLLWQNGANMYSYSNDKWNVDVDSAKTREVADYWQKLISDGTVRTDLASGSTPQFAAFEKDELATNVSAAWGYSMLRDNLPDQSGKWRVAPLPTFAADSKASGNWGGSTVAFMKGNKHLYESVKFNLWLNTDPEALALENSLGGLYPAANAGLELPALTAGVDYYGGQKIFDVFKDASNNVNPDFTWGPTQKTVNVALQDAMAKSVNNGGSLSDALKAAQAKAISSMKDQDIPVNAK
ncbi:MULTISPECIES: ABC transporter substrate-binding protein [unclassified Plantibacter]|uniref:ABC transporter substrate-binding protein n=1 Tax=unclassified Plantibacter TaxID=2624265 RepID=UPI003D34EE67